MSGEFSSQPDSACKLGKVFGYGVVRQWSGVIDNSVGSDCGEQIILSVQGPLEQFLVERFPPSKVGSHTDERRPELLVYFVFVSFLKVPCGQSILDTRFQIALLTAKLSRIITFSLPTFPLLK